MTAEEFLLDMLEHYSADPEGRRCTGQMSIEGRITCAYHPSTINKEETSEGCAIGRHLDSDDAKSIDKEYGFGSVSCDSEAVYKVMPQWMREIDTNMLQKVQALHDEPSNWTDKELSDSGQYQLQIIINKNKLDKNKFSKYLN